MAKSYQVCSRLNDYYFSLLNDFVEFQSEATKQDTDRSNEIRNILIENLDNLEKIPRFKEWREKRNGS